MTRPTTEAGRNLVAAYIDDASGMATLDLDEFPDAILAIERQAAVKERERIVALINALPPFYRYRHDVLAFIQEAPE